MQGVPLDLLQDGSYPRGVQIMYCLICFGITSCDVVFVTLRSTPESSNFRRVYSCIIVVVAALHLVGLAWIAIVFSDFVQGKDFETSIYRVDLLGLMP